jgi:glycosyltransferase involved in cell wall biosynthesis
VTRVDSADAFTLWWLSRRARLLLVCSQEERRRVAHILPSVRAQVVAHFVESRPPIPSMTDAKASLGLSGQRVVTLLGFIHGRKGHDLLVDAMPRLAPDVTVVFAGGATAEHEAYVERLRDRARTLGVAHRLRVTGRLAEPELERWMACTDLAVCPFVRVAASGSVSTWLSLGKPILATDLPLIAEYNAMEPGAIRCFRPYTATALADAITSVLSEADDRQAEAAGRLRDHLSIAAVCERHLALLTEHIQASTTVKNAAPSMVTHGASC